MQNFKRVSEGLNVTPVVEAIEAHPELWDEITIRQDYEGSAHKDTACIFLRGPKSFTPDDYFFDLGSYDYPAVDLLADSLVPLLQPLLRDVLKVEELGRVLIVRLEPNGHIESHVDEGEYADHFTRFHLALTGDDGSTLTCGSETVHFAPGELWWFDHKVEHYADNKSEKPRIHIIIDAVTSMYPRLKGARTDN